MRSALASVYRLPDSQYFRKKYQLSFFIFPFVSVSNCPVLHVISHFCTFAHVLNRVSSHFFLHRRGETAGHPSHSWFHLKNVYVCVLPSKKLRLKSWPSRLFSIDYSHIFCTCDVVTSATIPLFEPVLNRPSLYPKRQATGKRQSFSQSRPAVKAFPSV